MLHEASFSYRLDVARTVNGTWPSSLSRVWPSLAESGNCTTTVDGFTGKLCDWNTLTFVDSSHHVKCCCERRNQAGY